MDKLVVIKIGGNIVDSEANLALFLDRFAALKAKKILIHGGGKLATRLAEQMNIPQQLVDGRRITDSETLKVVTMVYAGYINKQVVSALHARHCNAAGFSGADGNLIRAHKRTGGNIDYGYAGDVDEVNAGLLTTLLEAGLVPVLAPITHDGKGQLLNTNADTIAQETAKALSRHYEVHLVYSFEKEGVLLHVDDPLSVISTIDPQTYTELKAKGSIFAGMIPKLDNAFAALEKGVRRVIIGKAEDIDQLITGEKGTSIVTG